MKRYFLFILGVLLLAVSCKNSGEQEKLTIATAANMQYAMEKITVAFSEQSGIETELVVGSSGMLTAQIASGAPFDIFISADLQYPEYLYEEGLGYQKPDVYAYGQLVLWTCKKGIVPSLSLLKEESVSHIAMANPELAPYGTAAKEVLIEGELYDQVSDKLVYGESITQTNQFIRTGAAEIGFTSLSVVMSEQIEGTGQWVLMPDSAYKPIAQGILILDNHKHRLDNALKFHKFLLSEKGQQILEKNGYLPVNE